MDSFDQATGVNRAVFRLRKKDGDQSALVPLNLLRVQLTGKEQSELKRLNLLQIERQLYDVSTSYDTLVLLQHWSNLVLQSQGSHQADERLFRLLDHMTTFLLDPFEKKRLPLINLYFEIWLLCISGVFPLIRKVEQVQAGSNGGFSLNGSDFVMQTNSKCSNSEGGILVHCFKQRIEDFLNYAIQYPNPVCLFEAAGLLWDTLLEKKIHTRTILLDCFREKGYL